MRLSILAYILGALTHSAFGWPYVWGIVAGTIGIHFIYQRVKGQA